MSGSKIRNIAIVALVLVNALFLSVIIIDAVDDARAQRASVENISAILQANGISIEPDVIRATDALRTMRTARVIEVEESIARALLGETVITDQGVIYLYENAERGIAEFYSGGDFEIRLNVPNTVEWSPYVITDDGGALNAVRAVLRDMGIEATHLTNYTCPERYFDIVTAVVAYRGASIFNCTIEFVFSAGFLVTVSGRYVAGVEPAENGAELSNVSSALLRFMAAVRDGDRQDIICTEIMSIEAGFRHRVVGAFGEGVIEPVWLIMTDNGSFMIDDATGEIWRT